MMKLKVLPTILKSMFYQANWNIENMQGTGFSWLVKDLFKRNNVEFPKDFKLKEPEYFNTNPYLITFILGMILKESQTNEKLSDYKKIYSSALAALGDTFFWHSLRPFTFFLAIWVAFFDPNLVVVVYLIVYNTFHLGFRFIGFYYGYALGRNVISIFNKIAFSRWSFIFDSLTIFLSGIAIAALINKQPDVNDAFIFKAIVLFISGFILSRVMKAPIGLMFAATTLAIMLIVEG